MNGRLAYCLITVIVIFAVAGGVLVWIYQKNQPSTPSTLDAFVKCLEDKGVKFYGAFWCPHCQREKALFGSSEKYLPYVECSTPDGNDQLQVCIQENIKAYPTWQFSDGSRQEGELTLRELSEKSGCQLSQ